MSASLKSIIAAGTKLWVDSIDPELVRENRAFGATGATSNPVIVSELIKTGRFDDYIEKLVNKGHDDHDLAWALTDELVKEAQAVFHTVWKETRGDDGYVSFELDPLLEDPEANLPHAERVKRYLELGKRWAKDHDNRMIKVPATPAGLDSLEELCAAGVTLNVTLIFSSRQYQAARDAIWRGAQRRASLAEFKSVYSIFVSRVDLYTDKHAPDLSSAAQGMVGIVNAKRIWRENQEFWKQRPTPLAQEMIFASTGVKKPQDKPWKYVAAFCGDDIQTNPPATNQAVADSGLTFTREIDEMPPQAVLDEIDQKIDVAKMEEVLMSEGIEKFASPQKSLLKLIAQRRQTLAETK